MSSVNKVFILGRLGKDPEVRYTADGKAVASLSVATSTFGKDSAGNKTEHTEWHRLSAFNKAAEVAGKYLKKGDLVHVEGSLRTRKWDDNGTDRYSTDIVIGRMNLLSSKSAGNDQQTSAMGNTMDDDLPF